MEKIIVEDRTTETPEQLLEREVLAAGRLIAGFTVRVSGARPPVGLSALAYVLGMGAARTNCALEEALDAVRKHYEGARAAMSIEAGVQRLVVAAEEEGEDDDVESDAEDDPEDEGAPVTN